MSNPHKPNFEQSFIDFPTGFWLQENHPVWGEHDPACSARLTHGGFLCDCDWLELEWMRYRTSAVLDAASNDAGGRTGAGE